MSPKSVLSPGTLLERSLTFSSRPASSLSSHYDRPASHRSEEFYFDDGNVVFQVQDVVYNVHRFFFKRDSPVFRKAFERAGQPLADAGNQPTANVDPIFLSDVDCIEFERFLSVFYPLDFGMYTATTAEEWASILDLAAKWEFESIRRLAIKQLTRLASPVDKIVWGRKHHILEWLPSAYHALCQRREALSFEEGKRLGMDEVIKISEARQAVRRNAGLVPSEVMSATIHAVFGLDDGGGLQERIEVMEFNYLSESPSRKSPSFFGKPSREEREEVEPSPTSSPTLYRPSERSSSRYIQTRKPGSNLSPTGRVLNPTAKRTSSLDPVAPSASTSRERKSKSPEGGQTHQRSWSDWKPPASPEGGDDHDEGFPERDLLDQDNLLEPPSPGLFGPRSPSDFGQELPESRNGKRAMRDFGDW